MDKLIRSANIVIGVGKLCLAHGLVEKDLPDNLRAILKSLHRYFQPMLFKFRYLTHTSDLGGIEVALAQSAEKGVVMTWLLRKDMLQRVRKYDAKLSNALQIFQVRLESVLYSLPCRADTWHYRMSSF